MPDVLDDPLLLFRNRDVSGGMNDKVFPTQIRDDQAVELLDVDISVPGRRSKRKGYTLIADDKGSERVNSLLDFKPDGLTQNLLHRAGTDMRRWSGSGNWTDISTTLVNDVHADMVQAKSLAFVLQGSGGNVQTWDGSTLTDEGNTNTDAPRTTHGVYALNRLFLAGNTADPTFLFYSDALDPQTWDRTANAVKFDEGGGSVINGVEAWNKNNLIIATDRNIHLLDISDSDPGNWSRELITPNFGCVAFRTLKRVGNDIYYLSSDRKLRSILRTEQDAIRGTDTPLTEAIETFLQDIDLTRIDESTAVFFEEAYYLAIPIIGNNRNSHVIRLDTQSQGLSIYRNWNAQSWETSDIVADEVRLYGGESQADTKVYRFEVDFNDNGTAIEFSETTKRVDFDRPEADKRWQWIEVELIAGGSGSLLVEAQVDGGGYTTVGTISLATNQPTLPVDLEFDLGGTTIARDKLDLDNLGRGRDIQFRLTNDTLDLELDVLGFAVAAFIEEIESE